MAYQHAGQISEDDLQAAITSAADAYAMRPTTMAPAHMGSDGAQRYLPPTLADPADIPLSTFEPPGNASDDEKRHKKQQQHRGYKSANGNEADDSSASDDDEDYLDRVAGDDNNSPMASQPPPHHVMHGPHESAMSMYGHEHRDNVPSTSAVADASAGIPAGVKQGGWPEQQDTLIGRDGPYVDEKAGMRLTGGLGGDTTPPSRPISSAGMSSADETDDFDWDTSTDEEVDEVSKAIGPDGRKRIRARRGRKVYLACLRLARPVRIFLFAIIATIIALVPFIVAIAAFPNAPARAQVQVWSIWVAIIIAASAGTFVFVDWIPALLMRLSVAVYGKAREVFKFYIEVIMATGLYVKLLGCVSWAWISLGGVLAIQFAYADRPPYFVWIVRLLQALFGTACILLAEKILLHLIAINFHKTAVRDRLENNQKALRVLDKLYESKYEAPSRSARSAWASGYWGRSFMGYGANGSRPGSPGPHTPGGIGSHVHYKPRDDGGYFKTSQASGDLQSQAQGQTQTQHHQNHMPHIHRHHKGQPSEHDISKAARRANVASQLAEALQMATMKNSKLFKGKQGSAQSARRLAKKLFNNLSHNRKYLIADDFVPYFKNEEEAKEAFQVFDADKNGDITKTEMREAVQRIYKERRALSASLKDISSAISKLDSVLLFVGLLIAIFVWLLIFNRNQTIANLVPLSTFIVSFSFVFGNTLKTIFESMIFIFATHPYDSGDLVCIDDVWMFVKDFGLISTTFRTTTNEEIVAPNALLATSKFIHNARRSNSQWEVTKVMCSFETALATIDEFRKRLRAYVKENDREWGGGLDVNFDEIDNMNCINLVIAMEHKGNWQDWGARWARRTKLMREVKTIAEQLGMEYQLPPQPISFHPRSGAAPFSPARFANLQRNATQRHSQQTQQDTNSLLQPGHGARRGLSLRL
ncbi:hypothetical protein K437DRAFT_268882 [Tilletiaria anomala UBC 951]|uniref:EF-hand domain-containing protein n=1 Tax=Tilletiaria anomala (strain ATCC 24038 / CBS 436.72 / UBC 951) TaxID=1037660 RepID=A0A066VQV8_TILAU|nr:uncharacterized protein K437DRAFT_268882 [Tilletiaria anomala UBC 951]KDN44132.1 hypothetical protein K437DRAFT_268882 [Tilletiaria anomala UBC 951]